MESDSERYYGGSDDRGDVFESNPKIFCEIWDSLGGDVFHLL
jgi:hypothetical protein